jgi:uncharacterized lipoprotein
MEVTMKLVLAFLAVLPMVGCVMPPTTVATPRASTSVNASFDRTWNAVIDVFAEQNIPIATMEKASGFIVADAQFVGADAKQAEEWADCGTTYGSANPATAGKYNVLVRSVDDHTATVKVTATWAGGGAYKCVTKGVWETDFEKSIKSRAEAPQAGK